MDRVTLDFSAENIITVNLMVFGGAAIVALIFHGVRQFSNAQQQQKMAA